jgi:hypothetical protein
MIAGDRINAIRRYGEERIDQAWATLRHRYGPRARIGAFDGNPRLTVITVNRSTTRYLKLMLLTLAEQDELSIVRRVIVVDNGSRDGGDEFMNALAATVPRVEVVRNRWFLNHARGMRAGMSTLDRAERDEPRHDRANILLFCDPDVIFRKPDALLTLASVITVHEGAFAGELRQTTRSFPDAQASFIAVRRDWLARRDITPLVNHGSPALWMQESIWRAGGVVVDFPSNLGGYILHRGRAAVAASREYAPWGSYATVKGTAPSYMGVADGAQIWEAVEARWERWLQPENSNRLIVRLAERFTCR